MLTQLRLLPDLPIQVRTGDRNGDGITVREETHINGPFHQIIGGSVPVLAVIVIALNELHAIVIQSLQIQDPVRFADGKLHVGVDLDAQCTVGKEIGLIVPEENQAEAGGQTSDPGQRFHPKGIFLYGLTQRYNVFYGVAHVITEVCGLEKAALFIQHHRISGVRFHHKIVHCRWPPFAGERRYRCPRMIS